MPSFVYHSAKKAIMDGSIDFSAPDTFKIALLAATHTPDQVNHEDLLDISADEISGSGYSAGGYTLSGPTLTRTGATVKFDADDYIVAALTPDFRYAVVYDDTHANDILIALLDPGSLQEPGGEAVKLSFHANGIFTLTDAV